MAEPLFGGVFSGGGGGDLFSERNSFRVKPAAPAPFAPRREEAADAPAAAAAPRARPRGGAAPPSDSDDDSDDERQTRRKARRREEAEEQRAGGGPEKLSRRGAARARAQPVAIEPPEQDALQHKRKRDAAADGAPAAPRVADADNADKAARTVFVGNLAAATKPKRLKQLFTPCGVVESVRLRSVAVDPEAKVPLRAAVLTGQRNAAVESVNGYVVFQSADAVPAALALNMRVVDGRHLRVDALGGARAGQPGARGAAGALMASQLDPRRSVYLGNLHYAIDEEEVIAAFSSGGSARPTLRAGCVEAVRIPRDRATGRSRGFGYVCFVSADAVRDALALAGTPIRGRPLRVARASAKRAVLAATARATAAGAHAALAALPDRATRRAEAAAAASAADVAAGDVGGGDEAGAPKMARWKARALKAAASGDASAAALLARGEQAAPVAAAARGPAPWEGSHATPAARPQSAAAGGEGKAPKVRTKPRWRDLGRDVGTPLAAGAARVLAPRAPAPGVVKPKKRGVGAKLGMGKEGGTKRVSGRKRPAVQARKAAIARKKAGGA